MEDLKNNLKHSKNVGVLCADYSNKERERGSEGEESRGSEGGGNEGRERKRGRETGRERGTADEREVVRAALESGSSLVPCHSFGDSHAFDSSSSLPLSSPNNANKNKSKSVFTSFLSDLHKLKNLFFAFSGRCYLPVPYR
jgi:hypothetical protein